MRFLYVAAVLLCLTGATARAANWQWQLSAERYKVMNQFERAQYDKAAGLVQGGNFVAAATEFEKFKVQFPESANLSYAILMRGYCLHKANQRNGAVKVYQEVSDYFADQPADASAALFFQGEAHIENGEVGKGLRCFKSLVENPAMRQQPLTVAAVRLLADDAWGKGKVEEAMTYWRKAYRDFEGVNEAERASALRNLTMCYIINADYKSWENLIFATPADAEAPDKRRQAAQLIWDCGWGLYNGQFKRLTTPDANAKAAEGKAFYEYFKSTRPVWEKANDPFGYFERALTCLTRVYGTAEERTAVLEDAIKTLRAEPNKPAADLKIARLVDIMREGAQPELARRCMAAMTDRNLATSKEFELLRDMKKYKECLLPLDALEASGDAAWMSRALDERANLYKDALGEYEKAIKIYIQIDRPPQTLWAIQECYKRWGKLDKALETLTEIENLFPPEASRAVWHKAAYYREAGENKKAIAHARRLLKAFPKSAEASEAHQMLEKFGVPIGGGVTDEH